MSFEDIFSECTHDYLMHLNGVKESLNQLNKDKEVILGNYSMETAPDNIKSIIERNKKSWQNEWGMYGSRVKKLVERHQKKVYEEVNRKEIAKDLTAQNEQAKEKDKQNGRGR